MRRKAAERPTTTAAPTPSHAEHGRAANKAVEQRQREPRRSHRAFRGRPPPPEEFDFDALADGVLLTEYECAQVLRLSTNTLSTWRTRGHALLPWVEIAHGVRYRVRDVRGFMNRPRARRYPKPPGRPRRADRRAEESRHEPPPA